MVRDGYMSAKCNICIKFDCGVKCECICHHGSSPKIRQDHGAEGQAQLQSYNKSDEDKSMEGLSNLFG